MPVFNILYTYSLKKRDQIIAGIKSRIVKKSHKYGIELPKTVEDAIELDK